MTWSGKAGRRAVARALGVREGQEVGREQGVQSGRGVRGVCLQGLCGGGSSGNRSTRVESALERG